ncbi:PDZ domain-containing protein [Caulobacter segnis]|uniref:Membrane-associated zinc metalloprotease n=2 Tax=Caulobacter segnis TaxID=88688 RepID=D5VJY7_CAUST|nr:M50 family metallopeptidase [Caulobacter segnis]ADG10666.1 membrane-associated zinc metalloprotease [Caulobacter segnis ATCC 21756]AVQ02379.1 PDZ domain-containing protein [Caulobacter segnis]
MTDVLFYIVPTVFVLSIVVTIHELGHFWVARACGVAIDCFSIGFGRALVSWRDKQGVEWRIAAIPLGGYVRFSGDENAASVPDQNDLSAMKRAIIEREGEAAVNRYFHFKPVWQRALIAVAGPMANFILAILIMAVFLVVIGNPRGQASVREVQPNSPAAQAGLLPGDILLRADKTPLRGAGDVSAYISLRAKMPIDLTIERAGRIQHVTVVPALAESRDDIRGRVKEGRMGVVLASVSKLEKSSLISAIPDATVEVWNMVKTIGFYLGRLVTGQMPADQISGIIGIGHTAGAVTKASAAGAPDMATMALRVFVSSMLLIASLSVSIGFMNLLPIPVLDGGHLLMYAYEAVARRPLRADFQAAGFRAGLALILGFMLFAAWNDLNRYDVFKFIGGLFT